MKINLRLYSYANKIVKYPLLENIFLYAFQNNSWLISTFPWNTLTYIQLVQFSSRDF